MIERVTRNALGIARDEECTADELHVVELAALLHDLKDHKYHRDIQTGRFNAAVEVEHLLVDCGLNADIVDATCFVVGTIGFSKELERSEKGVEATNPAVTVLRCDLLLAIVSDADQLDALGAIGVARCLTYGGAKGRVLYDQALPPRVNMSAKEYRDGNSTTMNHFPEKLFRLKDRMKTSSGRRRAERRDAYMLEYYDRFMREIDGTE